MLIISNYNSFAQVTELEKFKKELVFFLKYDNSKMETIPKSESNTLKLKIKLENSFKEFILNPDSKNLNNLKKNGTDNKSSYIIGNNSYYFAELRRDYSNKSTENNLNYQITFPGMYDYKLSNFISIYIQPFTIGKKEFVIYYYKLNGKGVYYIKDINKNKIIFESNALTSNAPILKIEKIDDINYLIVEDMQNNGQRAFVLNVENEKWKALNAFKGKSFNMDSLDFKVKKENNSRKYLWIANSKKIITHFSEGFFEKPLIIFDAKTKNISYKKYNKIEKEAKVIYSIWKKSTFIIDDYFIGEDFGDGEMPFPN